MRRRRSTAEWTNNDTADEFTHKPSAPQTDRCIHIISLSYNAIRQWLVQTKAWCGQLVVMFRWSFVCGSESSSCFIHQIIVWHSYKHRQAQHSTYCPAIQLKQPITLPVKTSHAHKRFETHTTLHTPNIHFINHSKLKTHMHKLYSPPNIIPEIPYM